MKNHALTVLCSLAAVFAAGASAADRQVTLRDEVERTLPFPAAGDLVLENRHGSLELVGWDRPEIHVRAELSAKAEDEEAARRVLDKIDVRIENGPRGVEIRTDDPRLAELTGDVYGSVRYTVSLPVDAGLRVSTVDGGIRIAGIRGAVKARTVNGSIEVVDAGEQVEARGANGGVRVEVDRLGASGRIEAVTAHGKVVLVLPPDADADLEVRTEQGSIVTDFPVTVQGEMGKTRLKGRLGDGGASVVLRTVHGGVEIRERR